MNAMTAHTGMMSDAQRSALAARLRQGRSGGGPAGGIPRRDPGLAELPLSFGQEQLWFIDQLAPGLSVYNLGATVRLRGPLDIAALGAALDALRARHEPLRTRLAAPGGRPVQVIDPPRAIPLEAEDPGAALGPLAVSEAARPFDLAAGPLLRIRLFRLGPAEHALLVCVHHAVFDGWSFGVLLRELAALYEAEVTGQPAGLPALPVQYADYALWERGRLQGQALADLTGYWQGQLAGAAAVSMPADRPRPPVQGYDGAIEELDLGAGVLRGLRELSRREGTTLFVTLLAAIHALVHRYTGQDDITIGTASANRSRPELAGLIGYLVNTLAIRADVAGDPLFTDLLAQVRATTIEAYAHQDLPFARLVDALKVERDPSRSPVFQIGFTMTEDPGAGVAGGGVTMTPESVDILAAKTDLAFYIETSGTQLRGLVFYATALFDAATARRMLAHLRELLAGIAADPRRKLSELPLLTAAELRRELTEWNDTAASYPAACVHEIVEQQAARTPEATAVVLGSERVSYAALDADASRVARYLRGRGIGPQTLVGVSLDRSPRRLAVLLGIMKAGGGYVPLDPDLPADRLRYMIEDARLPVILADPASAARLPGVVVDLDEAWPGIAALPGTSPGYPVAPDSAIYVIYTSGSTGRPKGVVLEHRTVVNYVTGMAANLSAGPGDSIIQFASLGFDVSVMEMFVALCSGAAVVLGARETLHSPPRLADLMRAERVSIACLPPTVVNLLAGEPFPDLRALISTGEALAADTLRQWLRPGLRFCNGYGPTEATVGATLADLDAGCLPPPIGLPMPNYTAYVLDAHLHPLPVGAVGELHLGGPVLARGYLNQPELTRQRFIPDPFSAAPGARLYKTGDLARRLPDGRIQFLGRADGQVKIRGLRIELGEIEAVLGTHPAVAQALVTVTTDAAGQQQLTGYARVRPGAARPDPADLRHHLGRQLPGYMVPPHVLLLEEFPLNANGKIDRAALPRPDVTAAGYRPPRTLLQALLADVYADLLGCGRAGAADSFFDLGGNSLQAMRLVTRLRAELAVDLDVTAVFLAPSPAQLAALLCEQHGFADADLGEDGLGGLDAGELAG